jgi:hypothetical protein
VKARWRWLPVWLWLVLLAALMCSCLPAAVQAQAQAADAVAQAANAALGPLVASYRAQGLAAVSAAETEAEARAAWKKLDARFAPVWRAWRVFRLAHEAWVKRLRAGDDPASALQSFEAAWCLLATVWPPALSAIPWPEASCAAGPP